MRVPTPALKSATEGFKPVTIGTNTVAPNIAIKCCMAKSHFLKLAMLKLKAELFFYYIIYHDILLSSLTGLI
jgi:hypothetical protein